MEVVTGIRIIIELWPSDSGRANFQHFALELMQVLSVEKSQHVTCDDQNNRYRYERAADVGAKAHIWRMYPERQLRAASNPIA